MSGYTAGMLESTGTFSDSDTVLVDRPFTKDVLHGAVALVATREAASVTES